MQRFTVKFHDNYGPIKTITVEASTRENAARKTERNFRTVTSVTPIRPGQRAGEHIDYGTGGSEYYC